MMMMRVDRGGYPKRDNNMNNARDNNEERVEVIYSAVGDLFGGFYSGDLFGRDLTINIH